MRFKWNFLVGISKGTFGEEKAQSLIERTSVQMFDMGRISHGLGLCCSHTNLVPFVKKLKLKRKWLL